MVAHIERATFDNRELRRIFGPKRDKVTGVWRRRHYKELHDLYSTPNIFRVIKLQRMRWAGYVERIERKEMRTWFLFGKPEGKRKLGRLKYRWEDNI